jgi:predicted enzyme related to lactoylglutathione lyase
MNRVVHFEITAGNLDRAERFYANVFGWSFRRWNGPTEFRLITTGPDDAAGINGGLASAGCRTSSTPKGTTSERSSPTTR